MVKLFKTTEWCSMECKRYGVFFSAWNFYFACYLWNMTAFWQLDKIFMSHMSCFLALNFSVEVLQVSFPLYVKLSLLNTSHNLFSYYSDFSCKHQRKLVTHKTCVTPSLFHVCTNWKKLVLCVWSTFSICTIVCIASVLDPAHEKNVLACINKP